VNKNPIEKLLWSIALPGFGQFLNRKYFKGTVFLVLEFLVNVQANFNQVIIYSFHGEIQKAIEQTSYNWLMFYPCLYFFAMWDAYKDAGGGKKPNSFYPFAFGAFTVTVGLIYSSKIRLIGVLIGPVWLPIMFVIPGVIMGLTIQKVINRTF
jgi:hypothetical protein